MKTILAIFALFLLIGCVESTEGHSTTVNSDVVSAEAPNYTTDQEMQEFFDNGIGDQQVFFKGEVIKNLPDDNEGSRHQKFLVELNSGQTLLVSHNIDLANRVENLTEGDDIKVFGEYEWNERGGVVHWTHHDPNGSHIGGWIEYKDVFYE